MTELTCPTCGSKCVWSETEFCKKVSCCMNGHLKPLPQPDLTKLREAYREHMTLLTQEVMSDDDSDERVDRVIQSAGKLLQAVKELLKENKP